MTDQLNDIVQQAIREFDVLLYNSFTSPVYWRVIFGVHSVTAHTRDPLSITITKELTCDD
ncbi:MAG: hypothetical protein ACYTBJ_01065 [Planctomycetota bacterium]